MNSTDFLKEQSVVLRVGLGSLYLTTGLLGILTHALVIIGICINKNMRGTFYFLSLHNEVAEILSLMAAGIYVSLCIFWGENLHPIADMLFGGLADLGWYSSGWFLVLLSFTRFVAVKYKINFGAVKQKHYINLLVGFIWLTYFMCSVTYMSTSHIIYQPCLELYTFCYNANKSIVAYIMNNYNVVHNITTAILVFIFNLLALVHLKKANSQVESVGALSTSNHNAEVKLFLLCFTTSIIYCVGSILFVAYAFIDIPAVWYIINHIWWLLAHVNSGIVYLGLNSILRQTLIEKCFRCL